jgi:hypothetical protein
LCAAMDKTDCICRVSDRFSARAAVGTP